MKGGRVVVDAR